MFRFLDKVKIKSNEILRTILVPGLTTWFQSWPRHEGSTAADYEMEETGRRWVPGGVYRSQTGNIGRYEVELRPRRMEGHRESHGFLHESSVYREAFHPAGAETPLLFR